MSNAKELWILSQEEQELIWSRKYGTGMCGPFAIARATGFPLRDVLEALRKEGTFPRARQSGMTWRDARDFLVAVGGSPMDWTVYKMTLAQFTRRYPTGTYVIMVNGHALCVVAGEIIDPLNADPETPRNRRRVIEAVCIVQEANCTKSTGNDAK